MEFISTQMGAAMKASTKMTDPMDKEHKQPPMEESYMMANGPWANSSLDLETIYIPKVFYESFFPPLAIIKVVSF
jgi:hypothetical protein